MFLSAERYPGDFILGLGGAEFFFFLIEGEKSRVFKCHLFSCLLPPADQGLWEKGNEVMKEELRIVYSLGNGDKNLWSAFFVQDKVVANLLYASHYLSGLHCELYIICT